MMNTLRTCYVLFLAGLPVAGSSEATAYPITFEFSGTIMGVGDASGLLDGSIVVGGAFWGSYTFESIMTDDLPADPHYGLYTSPVPPSSTMIVTVGNYAFAGPSNRISVVNWDGPKDSFIMGSHDFQSEGLLITDMVVALQDWEGTVLASDALPTAPPALALMEWHAMSIQGHAGSVEFSLGGVISVLTPEPSSVALLGVGGLVFLARRRSR